MHSRAGAQVHFGPTSAWVAYSVFTVVSYLRLGVGKCTRDIDPSLRSCGGFIGKLQDHQILSPRVLAKSRKVNSQKQLGTGRKCKTWDWRTSLKRISRSKEGCAGFLSSSNQVLLEIPTEGRKQPSLGACTLQGTQAYEEIIIRY